MTSPFCEPYRLEYEASLATDMRGHGGILTDPRSGSLIPQYNLALAWKLPRLAPQLDPLVRPLVDARALKGALSRPPGQIRFDLNAELMRNRNLLAAENEDEPETDDVIVRLWTVSERSDRRLLEKFHVKIKENEERLYSRQQPSTSLELDEPANELRTARNLSGSALWIRSKRKLDVLWRTGKEEGHQVATVFQNSISSFSESPHISGEVSVCDSVGRVWSGRLDQSVHANLTRTKNYVGDELKLITHSDHPRVLYASADYHVRSLDLREDTEKTSKVLFGIKDYSDYWLDSVPPMWQHIQRAERPTIKHLQALPADRNSCLVMTDYAIYVVDERFPGTALLTLRHQIPYGSEFVYIPNENRHSKAFKGEHDCVQSIYFLSHYATGLHAVHLYRHDFEAGGSAWSSISPLSRCPAPSSYWHLVSQPAKGFNEYARRQMDEPIRGVAIVQEFAALSESNKSSRQFADTIFRSLDDGSLWYQTIQWDDGISRDEFREKKLLASEVEEWLSERETKRLTYLETAPETVEQPPKAACTLVQLKRQLNEEPRNMNWSPFEKNRREPVQIEPAAKVSNAKLAGLVETIWQKTALRAMGQYRDEVEKRQNEETLKRTEDSQMKKAKLGDKLENDALMRQPPAKVERIEDTVAGEEEEDDLFAGWDQE